MADATSIEQELEAIKAITSALTPFEAEARLRILQYATHHLGIKTDAPGVQNKPDSKAAGPQNAEDQTSVGSQRKITDIRTLREEKQPKTDVQMAAIVAYYLAELVPLDSRKEAIEPADISTYFKQAGHPLPKEPRFTLVNAKTAGYFESVGGGAYKLNPVGHNLVVHGLPKSGENDGPKPRKKTKKAAARKAKK
ncbi:MAG TPA: hypothetical protein DCX07_01695 [Phycisphaerales bacterium]|nr:hypothetical protein [Phycisphaerales bacterium]